MQLFSIAPNGLSDGKKECKADHKNNSSIVSENKILEALSLAKNYENAGTEVASWEAINQTTRLSTNLCRSDFVIAAENEITFSKIQS